MLQNIVIHPWLLLGTIKITVTKRKLCSRYVASFLSMQNELIPDKKKKTFFPEKNKLSWAKKQNLNKLRKMTCFLKEKLF